MRIEPLGAASFRGKAAPVEVHAVVGGDTPAELEAAGIPRGE
jgi:hypothetical protein